MTGYTPIYNLPYPQPSDLVSAYPGTGQDLAEEVETVLAAKANTSALATAGGLVLITAQSFNASVVNVNSVFTSTYDNYLITASIQESQNSTTTMRMRVGGVDASGANTYYFTGGFNTSPNNLADLGRTAPGPLFMAAYVFSPALAVPTRWAISRLLGSTGLTSAVTGIYHTPSTAYDGFSFGPDGGTVSGTLRVYGLKNS